jgi:hypothetical protein
MECARRQLDGRCVEVMLTTGLSEEGSQMSFDSDASPTAASKLDSGIPIPPPQGPDEPSSQPSPAAETSASLSFQDLDPELREAFEESWEKDQAAYRYLAR